MIKVHSYSETALVPYAAKNKQLLENIQKLFKTN